MYDVKVNNLNDDTIYESRVRDFLEIYLPEEPRKALFSQIFWDSVCSLETRGPDVDAVQILRPN